MSKKILVVDDNDDLRAEIRDFLDTYEIFEASSGEAALAILRRANDISLVILDVMMTGISGLDVLSEIKGKDPKVGVIILTGHSSKDVAIEALKLRADDYIEKPINIERFHEAVERMMAIHNGEPEISSLDIKGKMLKVKNFIEANRFKKIGLNDASDLVKLSPKYLSRGFKEHMKIGFNEYKLQVKIKQAKEILLKTGYTVNQISEKLGYENAESFIRQFKKIVRNTPAQYRKINHDKKNVAKRSKLRSK
ncbi:MAG: response regulator [Candidatus Omnitrophica bacterium]|nr:response regulator [Candidatus Omnitrophota bacterium]